MCGRAYFSYSGRQLAERYQRGEPGLGDAVVQESYNFSPGQVLRCLGRAGWFEAQWGLKPAWIAAGMVPPINTRVETAAQKPMFRDAYRLRRCIVPVSGFYEWRVLAGGAKQPYAIAREDGGILSLAGIWEGGEGQPRTFAVLTRDARAEACAELPEIHHRMPVVVPREREAAWLNGNAEDLLGWPCARLHVRPVSSRLGNPRAQGAQLLDEVPRAPQQLKFI